MKKFILLSLSITIFIFSSAIAFADSDSSADSSADLPQSALLSPVTDESEISIDNKLREASVLLAANSEFTANDIYNLLNACRISINGNTNLRVYDSSVVDAVNSLRTYISSVNDSLNAIGYGSLADIQVDTLTAINNVLSTLQYDTDSETITAIDMLRNILSAQVTDSQFDSFAIAVSNRWITENNQFTSISNDLAFIQSLLNDVHNDLTGVTNAINNNGSTLHTDFNTANNNIANILANNQHIDGDLHDLKQWLDDTFYYSVDKSSLSNFDDYYYRPSRTINSYPFVSSSNLIGNMTAEGSLFYPLIPLKSYVDRFYIDNLSINSVNHPSVAQLRIYDSSFNLLSSLSPSSSISISFEQYDDDTVCIIYNGLSDSLFDGSDNFVVFVPLISSYSWDFSFNRLNSATEFTPYIYTVNIESKSYYQDYKDTLDKFKDLYASDDLIAAKDAQQDYEDSALNDFTGSGSAAVPKSGLSDVKGLQGSVTNSLDSGASASDIVNILGNDTYLEFFSQSISDDLNGVNNGLSSQSQQNSRLKSSSNSGDEIVDLLGGRDAELKSLLGGNKW